MLLRGKNKKGKLTYSPNRKLKDKIKDWKSINKAKKVAKKCIDCIENKDGYCSKFKQWCSAVNENCTNNQ